MMNRRSFLATSAAFVAITLTATPSFAASRKGKFRGQSNHVTKGSVTVKGNKITLEGNFFFDGAPDPRIALGKGGRFSKGTDFAKLKKNKGKQTYTIPSRIDPDKHDTVVLWCRKFSVPLGFAKIG